MRNMEITRTPDGCTVFPGSPHVDRVLLEYDTGRCTVFFSDGRTSSFIRTWENYHVYMYGLHFSDDGKIMFTGDWRKGLFAIDPHNGETIWHYRPPRIRAIFAFPGYLIALRDGRSVIKLDVRTGELLGEITGRSLVSCWLLDGRHVLLDSKGGKLCVVDTESMETVKRYGISGMHSSVNPNNCLSLVIRDARLEEGKLIICGFEEYPNRDYSAACSAEFVRELEWL